MKLMIRELERRFAKVGSQEHVADPIVIAEFFNPTGLGTWLAAEYDPETWEIFGYASIFGDHNHEWGYTSLDELEAYRGQFGLGIERDLNWDEKPMSAALRELYGGPGQHHR